MDYEFFRDINGQVIAKLSMGHEAIGYWLTEEIKADLTKITQIEQAINSLMQTEQSWQLTGKEYSLSVNTEEIMVQANQLTFIQDDLEEGMSYYDEESLAFCGKEDFLALLVSYRQFILHID